MSPEDISETIYDRAASARVLLATPALVNALDTLRAQYNRQFIETPSTDPEMLVAIKARYEALDSFVQDLESTIAAPKFEKFNNKTAIRRGNNK